MTISNSLPFFANLRGSSDIAFAVGSKRKATVTAVGSVSCLKLSRGVFADVLGPMAHLMGFRRWDLDADGGYEIDTDESMSSNDIVRATLMEIGPPVLLGGLTTLTAGG